MLAKIALFVGVVLTYCGLSLAVNCATLPDGSVHEIGCLAYAICQGGLTYQIHCQNGQVYNQATQRCDGLENVPEPCGIRKDCRRVTNGRYPDLERNCRFYYTCDSGNFLGFNPCPGGLVFNSTISVCDWPYNVDPPCGTKYEFVGEELDVIG